MHSIYPNITPLCDRCHSSEATLGHSFVLCSKIAPFWRDIFKNISDIINTPLTPEPLLIILGVSEESRKLTKAQQQFLSYCLITAKKLLLMSWNQTTVPTFNKWLHDLTSTLHLEEIRYVLRDRLPQYNKIWQPLIAYLTHRVVI